MSDQPVGRIEQLTSTPGPWTWFDYPDGRKLLVAANRAVIHCLDAPIACEPADTRLIASAPELLAALREMVAIYDGTRDLLGATVAAKLARAEAALAKAEGRP